MRSEFEKLKCYFLNPGEPAKVEKIAADPKSGLMSPAVVGQPVKVIASLAGITVPPETKIIIAELEGVGRPIRFPAKCLPLFLPFMLEKTLSLLLRPA